MKTQIEVKQGSGVNAFLVVLCFFLCIGYYFLFDSRKSLQEENVKLSGNFTAMQDSFSTYMKKINDSTEVLVAKTKRITIEKEDWKQRYKQEYDLTKKLKLKNIESTTLVQAKVEDTVPVKTVIIDKLSGIDKLFFETKYMKASVDLNKNDLLKSKLHYKYSPDFLLVNHFEKKGFLFFKKKKFKESVLISQDTNFVLTNFQYKEFIE